MKWRLLIAVGLFAEVAAAGGSQSRGEAVGDHDARRGGACGAEDMSATRQHGKLTHSHRLLECLQRGQEDGGA